MRSGHASCVKGPDFSVGWQGGGLWVVLNKGKASASSPSIRQFIIAPTTGHMSFCGRHIVQLAQNLTRFSATPSEKGDVLVKRKNCKLCNHFDHLIKNLDSSTNVRPCRFDIVVSDWRIMLLCWMLWFPCFCFERDFIGYCRMRSFAATKKVARASIHESNACRNGSCDWQLASYNKRGSLSSLSFRLSRSPNNSIQRKVIWKC